MILQDYLGDLASEDAEKVRQILSEPHLENGLIKQICQQRRFYVINDLINILGKDEKLVSILHGIKVDEELRRIRNGYECATCLPEDYADEFLD